MIDYPEFVEVKNKKYPINTDFRIALKCEEIARDESIEDLERGLAIIYILFGKEALNDADNWEELLKLAIKYLKCGKQKDEREEPIEPDMSFKQDWGYIQASFMSDYKLDLSKEKMHWWAFYDLIEGLTEDSVLNRVRYVRNYDISKIKDQNERNEWIKRKKAVELKREKTAEELEIDKLFDNLMKGE